MESPSRFSNHLVTISIALCFFIRVSCVIAFGAKHGGRVSKHSQNASNQTVDPKLSPCTPKKIIKEISKKAIPYMCMKTKQQEGRNGDKCLWKKTILMGEKCQPLQFPGAIFYDSKGNQLSEPPRSPRTSLFHLSVLVPKRGEMEI